jgi:hypothetical protein
MLNYIKKVFKPVHQRGKIPLAVPVIYKCQPASLTRFLPSSKTSSKDVLQVAAVHFHYSKTPKMYSLINRYFISLRRTQIKYVNIFRINALNLTLHNRVRFHRFRDPRFKNSQRLRQPSLKMFQARSHQLGKSVFIY